MRAKLFLASVGTALAALAIAGCGGDDNTTTDAATTTGAPSTDGQVVDISETDFKLDPSDPTVQPGTVSFGVSNDGAVDHNLEVEGPEGEQELEQDLAPGQSGTLTVDLSQPGKYEFYCPVGDHRDRGMEGEITVGSGESGGSSGSDDEGGTTTTTTGGGEAAGGGGGGYGY